MCVCVCVCLKENQIKQQKTTKCHSTTNCCIFDNSGGPRRRRNFDQPKRRDETFLPPPSSLSLPPAASPMTYRPLPDWLSLCRTPLHRLTCFWFGRSSFSISPSLPYLFFFFFYIFLSLCWWRCFFLMTSFSGFDRRFIDMVFIFYTVQLHDDKFFVDWLTENQTGMYCCVCVCHAVRRTTPMTSDRRLNSTKTLLLPPRSPPPPNRNLMKARSPHSRPTVHVSLNDCPKVPIPVS